MKASAWAIVLGTLVLIAGAVGLTRFDRPASAGQVATVAGGLALTIGACAAEIVAELRKRR